MSSLLSTRAVPEGTPALSLPDLEYHLAGWLLDAEVRMLSAAYIAKRRHVKDKLVWFLRREGAAHCGPTEIRAFLAYLRGSHAAPGGRWGREGRAKPLTAATLRQYYALLHVFWAFVVAEGTLTRSPMETLKAPVARPDQIQPFSAAQQQAILAEAKRTRYPARNTALVLFLLDTGVRASELCAITCGDLSLDERSCRVKGKGGKERTVYFGGATARALWAHLFRHPREPATPLFMSMTGPREGEALTRMSLKALVADLGRRAGLKGVRCSPHTFRHTFAVEYLRAGGNQLALQLLLGHASLSMSARYVKLAEADLATVHRTASPVDRLLGKGRR